MVENNPASRSFVLVVGRFRDLEETGRRRARISCPIHNAQGQGRDLADMGIRGSCCSVVCSGVGCLGGR